jgi:hypothetical protein
MPIKLRENQYRGVNAHLHSLFQSDYGGWETFHADHIALLRQGLQAHLPETSGYFVLSERSLQIRLDAIENPTRKTFTTYPDIEVFGTRIRERMDAVRAAVGQPPSTTLDSPPETP